MTANITIELTNDHYGVPLSDGTHTQSIFFSHLILVGSIIDFFLAAGKKIIWGVVCGLNYGGYSKNDLTAS